MTKFLLASCALLAMGGAALAADIPQPPDAPPPPPQEASQLLFAGTLAIHGGIVFYEAAEIDSDEPRVPGIGGRASVSIPVFTTMSIQLDAAGERFLGIGPDLDPPDTDDSTLQEWVAAAHFSQRNPASHLIGLFGGGGVSTDNGDNGGPIPFWFVGLEGQLYRGDNTFYAQVGYLTADDNFTEVIEPGFFVRVAGYHYAGPDTRFGIEGSVLHGERLNGSPAGTTTVYGWGLSAEHQFGSALTLFGEYNGYFYDTRNSSENDAPFVHELRIGIEFAFGAPSLMDQDRRGVAVGLPPVTRWVSTLGNEIE